MFVPLAHAQFFGGAELMLNNRGVIEHIVTPKWYVEGRGPLAGPEIRLPASKADFYDINRLLPNGIRLSQITGLELGYNGKFREVWAQANLRPQQAAGPTQNLDDPFSMTADFKSSRLETAFPVLSKADRFVVALGNTSNHTLRVRVSDSQSERYVVLQPRSGQLLNQPAVQGSVDWLSLEADGTAGDLRASGFVLSSADSVPRLLRFTDPAASQGQDLFASGLRPDTDIRIAVRNISATPVVFVPEFLSMEDGSRLLSLPSVSLDAGQAISLEPDISTINAARVTLRLANRGAPESLVGTLHSADRHAQFGFEMPLRAAGAVRASTGGYPWRVDGDYETNVIVTNVGVVPAKVAARLHTSAGDYIFRPSRLAPGASVVFDLRTIRDQGIADATGNTIPTTVSGGQFYWSVRDWNADVHLAGRAEIVSRSQHISSSYSCFMCCPDTYLSSFMNYGSSSLDVGDSSWLDPYEWMENCYESNWSEPVDADSWNYNADVVSVLNDGHYGLFAEGDGNTTIHAYWGSTVWWVENQWQYEAACYNESASPDATEDVQVNPPTLTASATAVTRGNSITFTINRAQNGTISGWQYDAGVYETISRTTNTAAATWSGTLAAGGTPHATAVVNGRTYNLNGPSITINARNQAWSALSPQKVSNGTFYTFGPLSSGGTVLGEFNLQLPYQYAYNALGDNGPNHGIKYVTSTGFSGAQFRWELYPDLDSTSSDFYTKNCGQSGFISGSQLKSNIQEHESGSTTGHYAQYLSSNNSNNPGSAAEAYIGAVSTASNTFDSGLNNLLSSRVTTIVNDSRPDNACNSDVRYTPGCSFSGYINYPPYQSCPEPEPYNAQPGLANRSIGVTSLLSAIAGKRPVPVGPYSPIGSRARSYGRR